MRVPVQFSTVDDVNRFTEIVQNVQSDVWLVGKDENGSDWKISAKSFFCSLVIAARFQKNRKYTAHTVDWNTLHCKCDEDIYTLIQEFVKTGSGE